MYMELWKDIPRFNGDYQISTLGQVRNKKGLILKQKINKNRGEYKLIRFYGKKKLYRVHRLVAETFIPNVYNKPDVNHINGIKSDNRLENLEWVTKKENMSHAVTMGLHGGKSLKKNQKLTENDITNIKIMINNKVKYKTISEQYNISIGFITLIKQNKRRIYG